MPYVSIGYGWESQVFGPASTATTTEYIIPQSDGVSSLRITGTGFTYDGNGIPTGGTISTVELIINANGNALSIMTSINVSMADYGGALSSMLALRAQIPWAEAGLDALVSWTSTYIRVSNQDGTFTDFHGVGFDISAPWFPSGTVTSLELIASDGSTVLDSVTGLNDDVQDVIAAMGQETAADQLIQLLHTGANTVVYSEVVDGATTYTTGLLDGPGNDTYSGAGPGPYTPTVDFEFSEASVTANLVAGVATHGGETDTFLGTANLIGSRLDDSLIGDSYNNYFDGREGNDILNGAGGNDWLEGDLGDDTITGGDGSDTAAYGDEDVETGVTVSLAIAGAQNTIGAGIDTLIGIENLAGTHLADNLSGNSIANVIDGGDGADTIYGRQDNDTLLGGSGGDTIYGGDGADSLDGGDDSDLLDAGNDNDLISGGSSADTLYGRAGNDTLNGGAGADTMYGGAGDDIYIVDDTADSVGESASAGTDTIISFVTRALGQYQENLVLTGVAAIDGSGNILANTISGNDAANTLSGQAGFDILNGGAGNDTLNGGNGNDTLNGGNDQDTLDGGNDADTLNGGSGNDTLLGRTANDTLNGENGLDTLYGGDGDDALNGGADADMLDGGNHNDTLVGEAGADTLYGRQNDDTLTGGLGADTLYGGDGVDRLDGGDDADLLNGGNGADTFVFSSALGAGNIDTIAGFVVADDVIELDTSIFDAIGLGALDANAFVTGSAAADADDRIIYDPVTGALYYDADGDGAGAAVQFATLAPSLALTAADFIGGP